ncbi:MAG: exodeoxyribonuclease III [Ignavibacteriaceae bacterium]|nr:exodeoxyribonuclease III [Ignavibacteriaceae bacterium]
MKLISWNVNGIRAALKKGFLEYVKDENPDILCIQETKAQQGQAEVDLPDYTEYWNSAIKKGYSGTAIFTKNQPLKVINNIISEGKEIETTDKYGNANSEGRVITAEFEKFFVVTVYTPNAKQALERLEFRHKIWDVEFLKYLKELEKTKPVIFCGDLNVAHTEIDLKNPDTNHHSHGFTDEEREGFSNFIDAGFIDTFRKFHPGEPNHYTWWSNFGGARARNVGWRIDYFLVSKSLEDNLKDAFIKPAVMGSDHCPVGIVLEI